MSTLQNPPPLSAAELKHIQAYWRAANYLSVGQIYLLDNPLLKQPLGLEHIKPRLLGHWGPVPKSGGESGRDPAKTCRSANEAERSWR